MNIWQLYNNLFMLYNVKLLSSAVQAFKQCVPGNHFSPIIYSLIFLSQIPLTSYFSILYLIILALHAWNGLVTVIILAVCILERVQDSPAYKTGET